MPCNVFQLRGYRGEHRQYYYLTPILDDSGNLVDKYSRDNAIAMSMKILQAARYVKGHQCLQVTNSSVSHPEEDPIKIGVKTTSRGMMANTIIFGMKLKRKFASLRIILEGVEEVFFRVSNQSLLQK